MTSHRWGIVGGGMLGMTLALRLSQAGHRVTIIEAGDSLGGLAAPWTFGGVTWDRHYHVILNTDTHLLALLAEIGLGHELRWAQTRTGVYAEGKLFSVSNAIEYLRFPPLRMIDKMRMAWTILLGSRLSDWKALERVPVETWLRKHSGDRAFDLFWLPLLRSKLGDNYRRTSAAFIWATIQRLYSARRTGLKTEMFGYVRGGYARVISRLTEVLDEAGVEVLLHRRVESVTRQEGTIVIDTPGGVLQFDRAVVTLASPLAAGVIGGLDPVVADQMRSVAYQGIVCASMLSESSLGGYYVTNITDPSIPFTGVVEMTALVDRSEVGGMTLVYLPLYAAEDSPVARMGDSEIREIFVDAVAAMFPGFDNTDVIDFKVSRVSHVFPIPTLGYSEHVPPLRVSEGVYAVNSAHIVNGTLNVNETLQLARRVLPVLTDAEGDDDLPLHEVQPPASGARV